MRRPSPVLVTAAATITATTISQMSGLANPLSASTTAAAGLSGLVTPVSATSAMAIMDREPSGIALLMMPMMVPMNSANRCHALGVTPAGAGTANQMTSVRPTTARAGMGLSGADLGIMLPSAGAR